MNNTFVCPHCGKKIGPKKGRMCSINTERNDPVDIRCGGPAYLGFDFVLDASIPLKKWEKIITDALKKKYGSSSNGFSIGRPKEFPITTHFWTPEEVEKEIENY